MKKSSRPQSRDVTPEEARMALRVFSKAGIDLLYDLRDALAFVTDPKGRKGDGGGVGTAALLLPVFAICGFGLAASRWGMAAAIALTGITLLVAPAVKVLLAARQPSKRAA